MIDHYEFTLSLINGSFQNNQLDEANHIRLLEMLLDIDVEDLDRILEVNKQLIIALTDHKRQKISARLVVGAEKIEATEDPKEKARLMIHYNNLERELTA